MNTAAIICDDSWPQSFAAAAAAAATEAAAEATEADVDVDLWRIHLQPAPAYRVVGKSQFALIGFNFCCCCCRSPPVLCFVCCVVSACV